MERQELWLGSRKLKNERSLKSYGIQAGVPAIAHLEFEPLRGGGGSPITITTRVVVNDDCMTISSFTITCEETDCIEQLKKQIIAAMDPRILYPRGKIDLYYHYRKLANRRLRLFQYLVTEGAVIVAHYSPAPADDWPTCRL